MEPNKGGSPLSRICYQDSAYMLEAMLPFVPVNLKFPLAMLIKWNEIQRMIKVFSDIRLLEQYGLMEKEFSLQALQKQLTGCPNPGLANSLGQMAQAMQMMQMMQMMQAAENIQMPFMQNTANTQNASHLSHVIDDIINSYSEEGADAENTAYKETEVSDWNISDEDEGAEAAAQAEDLQENDFNIDEFVKEVFS